jgi:acetylornithine deacetylase
MDPKEFALNEERFVGLLDKLIGETKNLQNNPPELVPKEDLASDHVLKVLSPFTKDNGGPLTVERIAYKEGRGNVIITYPSAKEGAPTVAFVGSHLDVVPADPVGWNFDPFKLKIEGDFLYGRGTTDCLGHVALLTDLFCTLAEKKPALDVTVAAVFIASEESSIIPDVGVDMLEKDGKLDFLKGGPVYWVDSADSQPCIGTAAAIEWDLKVTGKLGHSGLPHRAINPIEMGSEALAIIQKRFYEDFKQHPEEVRYNFQCPSSMKPTQFKTAPGSSNQIPPNVTISGDIRLTPFYEVDDAINAIKKYVEEMNNDLSSIPTRGPSGYKLADGTIGKLEVDFPSTPYPGIACNIDSKGFSALKESTEEVIGECKPYSIGGSLPLVRELQQAGFDVQICGYGKSHVYHGDNEFCLLSDMKKATDIFSAMINKLNVSLNK